MVRRFKFWRLKRQCRHEHLVPPREGFGYFIHSHLHPEIDHQHEIDACCQRIACWDFPIHRVHPTSIL